MGISVRLNVRATPGGVGKLLSRVRVLGKDDADDRFKAIAERLRKGPAPDERTKKGN
jgi:hypothetical protein